MRMMMYKDQYPPLHGPLNPSNPIFVKLAILKVNDVLKLQVIKFIYDSLSFHTNIFWNWFSQNHTMHNYNTISNIPLLTESV